MAYIYRPAVAVDLDGVILEYDGWKGPDHFGDPLPGAKTFLRGLRDMDIRIIIHTARINNVAHEESISKTATKITAYLRKCDLEFDEVWAGRGKPIALAYIDDRAIFMSNRVCEDKMMGWNSVLAEISVAKTEADIRHELSPDTIAE